MVDEKKSVKPRMGVLLRQSVGKKSGNISADLIEIQKRYKDMKGDLKKMESALKQRHAAMIKTEQARFELAQLLANMSKDSPLVEVVGKPSAAERSASDVKTYSSVIDEWSKISKGHADKFKAFALDYVAQWESTVATRINADTKETDKLRRDADHYQTKVEALEKTIQKLEDKNKPVPAATTEKLTRNQEKLDESTTTYNRAAENLIMLMEEVVDRSWRDLHPLLIKCLKFDVDVHGDEEDVLTSLDNCVDELMDVAHTEDIKPRLDDIAKASPQDLTTATSTATTTTTSGSDDDDDDGDKAGKENDDEPVPEQPLKSSASSVVSTPFDEETN